MQIELRQVRRCLKPCQIAHTRVIHAKGCERLHFGLRDGIACGFTECFLNRGTEGSIRNRNRYSCWDDLRFFDVPRELRCHVGDGREISNPIVVEKEPREVRRVCERRDIGYLIVVEKEHSEARQARQGCDIHDSIVVKREPREIRGSLKPREVHDACFMGI